MKGICFWLMLVAASGLHAAPLRIGVTLHPYFSFVSNIVGDRAMVVPLIDNSANVHGYRATARDIERALDMDVLVVNGVGHDEFAFEILKAAGIEKKIPLIYAGKDVALIPQSARSQAVNAHTFVSITAAIQQIYTIARELAVLDKGNADFFQRNAVRYAARLRSLKAEYLKKLGSVPADALRCITLHGGYSYLLQEFGFEVAAVIEPGHGMAPGAAQLKSVISRITAGGIGVVFGESDYPSEQLKAIQTETGVRVAGLSHMSKGDYSAHFFEQAMRFNLDALVAAVKDGSP